MRSVIVTGGTKGLGLAITTRLVREGYRVIAVARQESEAFAALRGCADAKAGALHFCAFDLTDLDAMPGFVAATAKRFGPLYGLVNNAGLGTSGVLATMPERQIEALLRLNVASPIALTKGVVRAMMVTGGGGRIVNMSSIVASTGYSGLSVYAATKAALVGFTRSLARELGPLGITVNCVAPGFVATEMTQELNAGQRDKIARRSALRRLAEPSDVAAAIRYLLSEEAGNVTATVMTIDAGNSA